MLAITFALATALTYGVADYCGGRASRAAAATVVVLVGQALSIVVVLVGLAAFGDPVAPGRDWLIGLVAGVVGAAGLMAFYGAMAVGPMSVVAPVTAVVSAVVPVVWGLVRGDRPGTVSLVGMAAALVSVALVSGAGARAGSKVGLDVLARSAIGGLGFGGTFILLGETSDHAGLWPLLAMRLASVVLVASIVRRAGAGLSIPRHILPLAVASGSLDVTANGFYILGTRHGLLSVVAAVSSLYPASTVVLASVLDRERVSRSQALGLGFAAAALVLVSIGRA